MRTILGREPAVFFGMLAALLQALTLFFNLDPQLQGLINAALVAAAGFMTAAFVSVDAALPALAGLVQAVFAVLLGFGLDVPHSVQVAVMAVITAVAAFVVRASVTAKVPALHNGPVGAHAPFGSGT